MTKEIIENAIREILLAIGEDPSRAGLQQTPKRFAESIKYLTSGSRTNIPAIVNEALYEDGGDGEIVLKGIEFHSLCEHHLIPFSGTITIAYKPCNAIIGLSKLARIVDSFSRRLQQQERMTTEIADCIEGLVCPIGLGVIVEARHMCLEMRGIKKTQTTTITSVFRGSYKEDHKDLLDFK